VLGLRNLLSKMIQGSTRQMVSMRNQHLSSRRGQKVHMHDWGHEHLAAISSAYPSC
jgi:hypothetical protein